MSYRGNAGYNSFYNNYCCSYREEPKIFCCHNMLKKISNYLRDFFMDLKLVSILMCTWLIAVIFIMIEIGIFDNNNFVAFGPRKELSFMKVSIDTYYKYNMLIVMIVVHTFITDFIADSLTPHIVNVVQDTQTKYIPHKPITYFFVTTIWAVYCSISQLFAIFIAFAQIDLMIVRMLSDIMANWVTTSLYLHSKIHDPVKFSQNTNNNNHHRQRAGGGDAKKIQRGDQNNDNNNNNGGVDDDDDDDDDDYEVGDITKKLSKKRPRNSNNNGNNNDGNNNDEGGHFIIEQQFMTVDDEIIVEDGPNKNNNGKFTKIKQGKSKVKKMMMCSKRNHNDDEEASSKLLAESHREDNNMIITTPAPSSNFSIQGDDDEDGHTNNNNGGGGGGRSAA
jgi:hypothetical protein